MAVAASVALHIVAAGALVLFVWTGNDPKPVSAGIDTRATRAPEVRMSLAEVADASVEVPPQPAAPPSVAAPHVAEKPPPVLPEKPFATSVPRTLPPEMLAVIRKPAGGSASTPEHDPNVTPAGSANTATTAPAIHGALRPNQTVVYVLDCSGSMGAGGKFDLARASLVTTLKQQPPSVRFQVIAYAGGAAPLLAAGGNALLATEENVRSAAEKLARLEARGTSNHLAAVRAALAFRPDVILVLTDAEDLNAAAFRPILASAPKKATLCVGPVAASGVQGVRELK